MKYFKNEILIKSLALVTTFFIHLFLNLLSIIMNIVIIKILEIN